MKKMLKIVSLMLLIGTLASLFVGCGKIDVNSVSVNLLSKGYRVEWITDEDRIDDANVTDVKTKHIDEVVYGYKYKSNGLSESLYMYVCDNSETAGEIFEAIKEQVKDLIDGEDFKEGEVVYGINGNFVYFATDDAARDAGLIKE